MAGLGQLYRDLLRNGKERLVLKLCIELGLLHRQSLPLDSSLFKILADARHWDLALSQSEKVAV